MTEEEFDEEAPPGRWDGWLTPRIWAPGLAVLLLALAVTAGLYVRERGNGGATHSSHDATSGDSVELRPKIHEHADFAVFIRGQQFDFGKPEFISTAEKELSPNVHIHDPRHTVIHVHRFGTTWDEFFRSLGFELTDTCIKPPGGDKLCNNDRETLKFVVNGVRVDMIMFENIGALSRTLISYGSETDDQLMRQDAAVTDEACIPAGICLARGNGAGEHGEPCAASGTTCN